MRLVDDHHRGVPHLLEEVAVAVLDPVAHLLVGHHAREPAEPVAVEERLPHCGLERRGSDHEHALAVAVVRATDDLAGQERLAEADLVRHEHAAQAAEQALHPLHAVALELRELELGARRPLLVEVGAVELEQHPQEDGPGRVRLPLLGVQTGQVVLVAVRPVVLEPVDDAAGVLAGRVPEVQLGVAAEAGESEVARAGDDARERRVVRDVGLAVQEAVRVAADLDPRGTARVDGAQPLDHALRARGDLPVESHRVPLRAQPLLVRPERSGETGVVLRLVVLRGDGEATDRLLLRLSAEQQAHPRHLLQLVRKQREAAGIDVCGRDRRVRLGRVGLAEHPEHPIHLGGDGLSGVVAVRREDGELLGHATRPVDSTASRLSSASLASTDPLSLLVVFVPSNTSGSRSSSIPNSSQARASSSARASATSPASIGGPNRSQPSQPSCTASRAAREAMASWFEEAVQSGTGSV